MRTTRKHESIKDIEQIVMMNIVKKSRTILLKNQNLIIQAKDKLENKQRYSG